MEAVSQSKSPIKSEEISKEKLEKANQDLQDSNETIERLKIQGKKLKEQIEELKKEVELRQPKKVDYKKTSGKSQQQQAALLQGEKKKEPMPQEMETKILSQLELEKKNAEKQIEYYKIECEKANLQAQGSGPVKKIFQLEERTQIINQQISDTQIQIKNLEKIKRDHEKTIHNLQTEGNQSNQVNNLRKEAVILQDKIQTLQKQQEDKKKNYEKKQKIIEQLKAKMYQMGIPDLDAKTQGGNNTLNGNNNSNPKQLLSPTNRGKDIDQSKNSSLKKKKESDQYEVNEENYLKLKYAEKKQKKIFDYIELEKKKLEAKIQMQKQELQVINEKILEKEKEKQIAEQKLQDIKKLVRHNKLQPLGQSQITGQSGQEKDQTQKAHHYDQLHNDSSVHYYLQTGNRSTRRIIKGIQPKSTTMIHDDVNIIGDKNIDHQISQITIYGNETIIYGVRAMYVSGQNTIEGLCQIDENYQDITQQIKIELTEQDYIVKVSGSYNATRIDSIQIESQQGKIIKLGQAADTSTKFNFELSQNEVPITIFSGLDKQEDGRLLISSIGMEVKQK